MQHVTWNLTRSEYFWISPFSLALSLHRFIFPLCSLLMTSINTILSHLEVHDPHQNQFPPTPAASSWNPMPHHIRYHPNSVYIYGKAQNTLEHLAAETSQCDEEITWAHQNNIYYPFVDWGEWVLGKLLCENMNWGQISCFLKLEWVSDKYRPDAASNTKIIQFNKRIKPSFHSAEDLFSWMDSLPLGPWWQCTMIEMGEYIMVHPVYLLWWDVLKVMQMIFGSLIFHQLYVPGPTWSHHWQ